MADNVRWQTMVATALVSSFFTACLTEPVKGLVQRFFGRRLLRRVLYREISSNFEALYGQVFMALDSTEMRTGIGSRFSMSYKRLAYDLALKDVHGLYSLGSELYQIEFLYRDFERVINGEFVDEQARLSFAKSVCNYLLSILKNRDMSKRLMFKVGGAWTRRYFRARLPKMQYHDEPRSLREKILRRLDQAQYWLWGRLRGEVPPPF
jgi:hypothetical protein